MPTKFSHEVQDDIIGVDRARRYGIGPGRVRDFRVACSSVSLTHEEEEKMGDFF